MGSHLHTKSFLLGCDIGSSSVKAALVDADTKESIAVVHSPADAMPMHALHPGWAEQDPELWWSHLCIATRELLHKSSIDPKAIKGIGITYQMHGLVCVDKNQQVLRPAIIWCDSRAVEIGNRAFDEIGHERCLIHLLNSPGNFTASKLKWVMDNESEVYDRIDKFILPGDYIAMKLTGQVATTQGGLSEAMLWDFKNDAIADFVMDYFGFNKRQIPDIAPVFAIQGHLHDLSAAETGLATGTPVSYRSGDQPNNAMSLGVINPGEIAASGGTSGVVYGVVNTLASDKSSRVNSFMHVNHTKESPRIGILLCINGAGSQYNWVKQHVAQAGVSFAQMENEASLIAPGSDGLRMLPFGNGAERMLDNREVGAHLLNLDFNRHSRAHVYRAALEGIAHAFVYGIQIMEEMGVGSDVIKVGNDNLFRSRIFSSTIATLIGCRIEVLETTGAIGAAKAAGIATGIYTSLEEAFEGDKILMSYESEQNTERPIADFLKWKEDLQKWI
jgi:xylulokinase